MSAGARPSTEVVCSFLGSVSPFTLPRPQAASPRAPAPRAPLGDLRPQEDALHLLVLVLRLVAPRGALQAAPARAPRRHRGRDVPLRFQALPRVHERDVVRGQLRQLRPARPAPSLAPA